MKHDELKITVVGILVSFGVAAAAFILLGLRLGPDFAVTPDVVLACSVISSLITAGYALGLSNRSIQELEDKLDEEVINRLAEEDAKEDQKEN